MKNLLLTVLAGSLLGSVGFAHADQRVGGYRSKSGKYVSSYKRTSKDYTQRNNYSSKGNHNPYTGKKGTKTPKW